MTPSRPIADEDAFWHWIFNRRDLTVYEKAMLAGIKSAQDDGWKPRFLSHDQIAELASISRSMVIKLEPSLETRGFLKIHRLMRDGHVIRGRAFAYQVIQVQRELFNPTRTRGANACGNPVKEEWETPTPLISQVHPVREDPHLVHPMHSDPLRSSVNSKATSASRCAQTVQNSENQKAKAEWERRQEAKARREFLDAKGVPYQRKLEADKQREDYRAWANQVDDEIARERGGK